MSNLTRTQHPVSKQSESQNKLATGTVGWVLLSALGVSFVVSGDFAGWQFGLAAGGWGGLAVALVIVAILYGTMCLGLAELSASLPSAGGGYRFASVGLGRSAGLVVAAALILEYVIAPAAISTFIAGYVNSLGLIPAGNDWLIYLACYVVFVGIHLFGAGDAMKLMLVITAIALLAMVVYVAVCLPALSGENMAKPTGDLFPEGGYGIWAAIPFAIWFFLAVEGVPMAAEEAKNPAKDVPRAIVIAMIILFIAAVAMLIIGPGAAGTDLVGASDNPLVDVLIQIGAPAAITTAVNYAALLGLIASFFSITYGYSRLIYSLAGDHLLPQLFTHTNRRGAPVWALIIPAVLGFALTLCIDGETLMSVAVFGAVVSYALMMAAHIALRKQRPLMERPYRTPGGSFTTGIALTLSIGAIVAVFLSNPAVGIAGSIAIMLLTAVARFTPQASAKV